MPQPFSSIINPTKSMITTTTSSIFTTSSPSSCTLFSLLTFLLFLLITLFSLHHHRNNNTTSTTNIITPPPTTTHYKSLSQNAFAFLSSGSNTTISTYLQSLTLHPHLAGTPLSLSTALLVLSHFNSLNLSSHLTNYTTLLSYPSHSSLSAHTNSSTILFTLPEAFSSQNGVVLPYHAYSPSGSAYGKAVFVNYGREQDYLALGLAVNGCIAIVRRGGDMSRNAVVVKAAEKGVAAVLMYTEGLYKNGVERGTVMKGVGDPLTPGWASVGGSERLGFKDAEVIKRFPVVPSMPVSEETAERILRTLEGRRVPDKWKGSLKSIVRGIGPGPTMLNFSYQVCLSVCLDHLF